MNSSASRRPAWRSVTVLIVVALLAGGGLAWAGSVVFAPQEDVLDGTPFTTVAVVDGEVGSTLSMSAVAEWSPHPVGADLAAGTVTTVEIESGDEVDAGTVLYTVDLRPVVVAQGSIPAFRSLSEGTTGSDVRQLQRLLRGERLYSGDVSGTFGPVTAAAVRAWQKRLGMPVDGVVRAGDVIFVPRLPARISLDPELIARGARLNGGEQAVSALPAQPDFTIPVTTSQAALMPTGTRVEITAPDDSTWEAIVTDRVPDAEALDHVDIVLVGEGDQPICGGDCHLVPVIGESTLRASVVVQEEVSGLVVPSAALLTRADGSVAVLEADGTEHPVTVIAGARGLSVIEGVDEGLEVRVPVTGA